MPFLGTTGGGSVKQFGGQANLVYFIKNSLRFRSTGYLTKTLTTPTNNKIYTWSSWVKRGDLGGVENDIFVCRSAGTPYGFLTFRNTGSLTPNALNYADSVSGGALTTTQVFRDPSAWYHIVLAVDTTQATSSNRLKLYVNGTQITSFSTATYPTLNAANNINTASAHCIGNEVPNGTSEPLNGYLAEVNFIDGQALTPSSFGKTDAVTGQWIPKKFASTYGTNGFYLKFADASAATAAAIGKDSSPNGNNWTPNNISVTAGTTYDAMIDSPTLSAVASNYCVFNPLDVTSAVTLSEGNLKALAASGAVSLNIRGSIGVSSGKWYWETTVSVVSGAMMTGIGTAAVSQSGSGLNQTGAFCYFGTSASVGLYKGSSNSAVANTFIANDVIGIAFDADNLTIQFFKNNSSEGTLTGLTAGTYFPTVSCVPTTGAWFANFGQRPFTYTPPSGFKSLNTYNLP